MEAAHLELRAVEIRMHAIGKGGTTMKTSRWLSGAILAGVVTCTLVPSIGRTECDEKAHELMELAEQAQIDRANDATILNMYSKYNRDTVATMDHGMAPIPTDPQSREGVRRQEESDQKLRQRLQESAQTFDRRKGEIQRENQQGSSMLGDPCGTGTSKGGASSSKAKGEFPRSLPGLYATLLPDGNQKANFIYLFPGGTFFHDLPNEGFDGFDLARAQRDQLRAMFAGRYTVRDGTVVLRYGPGGYQGDVEIAVHEAGYFPNRSGSDYVQLPAVDGMALSGSYQLIDDQIPIFSLFGVTSLTATQAAITFTPDGRFVEGGIMGLVNQQVFLTNPNAVFQFRPGQGTYSLKNHTLSLRYGDGRTVRLSVHVRGNDRGEPNMNRLFVAGFRFKRAGEPLPNDSSASARTAGLAPLSARLPKLEPPAGWKSEYNPTKKITFLAPSTLPQGRTVVVFIRDPESLPDPDMSRFPERVHDAAVQVVVKGGKADGWRTERAMTRETQGNIPASTGVFTLPNGKRLWGTVFTLVSGTEGQAIVFLSEGEELHKAYLPVVRTMLGDGGASPASTKTGLAPLSEGLTKVNALRGWKSEYDSNNKTTKFVPPDLSPGRVAYVTLADPKKLTSSPARVHDDTVQEIIAGVARREWRLEGSMKRENLGNVPYSMGVFVLPNGTRFWMTVVTIASDTEGKGILLISDGEDLHNTYLPTVLKAMLDDAAIR